MACGYIRCSSPMCRCVFTAVSESVFVSLCVPGSLNFKYKRRRLLDSSVLLILAHSRSDRLNGCLPRSGICIATGNMCVRGVYDMRFMTTETYKVLDGGQCFSGNIVVFAQSVAARYLHIFTLPHELRVRFKKTIRFFSGCTMNMQKHSTF